MRKKQSATPLQCQKIFHTQEFTCSILWKEEKKNCMKVRGGGKEKSSHETVALGVHVQENQPRNSTSTSGKNLRSWPVFSFTYVLTNRWNNILWTYGTSKCLKQKTRNGEGEKLSDKHCTHLHTTFLWLYFADMLRLYGCPLPCTTHEPSWQTI